MDRAPAIPASGQALRLKNLAASAAVTAAACAVYLFSPYNQGQLDRVYGVPGFSTIGSDFLVRAALGYIALLALYYFSERNPRPSKSLRCVAVIGRFVRSPVATWRQGVTGEEGLALRVTLLKAFFAPMMVTSLMVFFLTAVSNGFVIAASTNAFAKGFLLFFDAYGFWFLLQVILFVDVWIFTIGYLVELPQLGNEIRSVDPTLMGWLAAVVCYPPFNHVTGIILGSPVSDFPRFDDPTAHLGLNLALLVLMAVYASASVALGFKASNLTHRGIIARGPYAVIRHPAYVCKNMAWWIASVPLVLTGFSHSLFEGVQAIASMVAWSMIYVLRALTEEDHLRGVDGEYADYAAKVRYRFIPGVY